MGKKGVKVPVGEWPLIRRINRKLAQDGIKIFKFRGDMPNKNLGPFYEVDLRNNSMLDDGLHLEALGRRLGCLKEYEYLRVK